MGRIDYLLILLLHNILRLGHLKALDTTSAKTASLREGSKDKWSDGKRAVKQRVEGFRKHCLNKYSNDNSGENSSSEDELVDSQESTIALICEHDNTIVDIQQQQDKNKKQIDRYDSIS